MVEYVFKLQCRMTQQELQKVSSMSCTFKDLILFGHVTFLRRHSYNNRRNAETKRVRDPSLSNLSASKNGLRRGLRCVRR